MMQEKGDEPVVKLAKDFIENCNDFEVRELPQKEQAKSADEPKTEQPDNLRVVQYDEYVKHEQAIGSLEEKSTWK